MRSTSISCDSSISLPIIRELSTAPCRRSRAMPLTAPAMRWLDRHPASFYTCFFLFSMGLASLFDPVRELASSLLAL